MLSVLLRAFRLRGARQRLLSRAATPAAAARCLVAFLTARAELTRSLRGFDPFYPVYDGNRAEVPPAAYLTPWVDDTLGLWQMLDAQAHFVRTSPPGLPPSRYGLPFQPAQADEITARADGAALAALVLGSLGSVRRQREAGAVYQALLAAAWPVLEALTARQATEPLPGFGALAWPPGADAEAIRRFLCLTHPWLAGERAVPPAFD